MAKCQVHPYFKKREWGLQTKLLLLQLDFAIRRSDTTNNAIYARKGAYANQIRKQGLRAGSSPMLFPAKKNPRSTERGFWWKQLDSNQ